MSCSLVREKTPPRQETVHWKPPRSLQLCGRHRGASPPTDRKPAGWTRHRAGSNPHAAINWIAFHDPAKFFSTLLARNFRHQWHSHFWLYAASFHSSLMKFEIRIAGKNRTVELTHTADRRQISLDGQPTNADAMEIAPNIFSILLNGQSHEIRITPQPDGRLTLQTANHEFTAEVADPRA